MDPTRQFAEHRIQRPAGCASCDLCSGTFLLPNQVAVASGPSRFPLSRFQIKTTIILTRTVYKTTICNNIL